MSSKRFRSFRSPYAISLSKDGLPMAISLQSNLSNLGRRARGSRFGRIDHVRYSVGRLGAAGGARGR
jgi:hypothetical protein